MTVSFRIFPKRGLCFVQYDGALRVEETFEAFGRYMAHPDCRPGQKQLVDLARVTGFDQDYATLFQLQAKKVDVFAAGGGETLIVYHAPTRIARDLSRLVLRSWEPFDAVVPLIQDTEAGALAVLGQPETSFDALLAYSDTV